MRIILALVTLLCCQQSLSAENVLIQSPQSKDDASYGYYVDLISQVLSDTQDEYGAAKLVETGSSYTQHRGLSALDSGQISVFWAGTDPKRERRYHVVRVPLMAGLLGIRVPVILASQHHLFQTLDNEDQLKSLTACQGTHWPDTDILEKNGYQVEKVTKFESMYSMLRQGRCDYFPRGIGEVYAELAHESNQDMMAIKNLLLIYPMPMYIFLSKGNKQLAERLTQGLNVMAEQGEIFEFVRQHPATQGVFPLAQYNNAKQFKLTNHLLPDTTELDNPSLWFEIESESEAK
jgi:hypothetical protein